MKLTHLAVLLRVTTLTRAIKGPYTQQPLKPEKPDETAIPWAFHLEDTLDDYINNLLKGYHIPGLSLAIVDNDQIATNGYGHARLPNIHATPDTLWFTGSTTKAFLSTTLSLITRNVSQATLSWTSRINDYLPTFALADDYLTHHITFEDALSHRTGLGRHDRAYGWTSLSEMIRTLRTLPLAAEARSTFIYCNIMVMVVSHALERITSTKIFDLIRMYLWNSLGMRSTFFFPAEFDHVDSEETRARLARGYYFVDEYLSPDGTEHYVPEPYMDLTTIAGAGATVSTVTDYALWIRVLLSADRHSPLPANKSSPVTSEIYNELTRPRIAMLDDEITLTKNDIRRPNGYALGWMTGSYPGGGVLVGHTGSLRGFGTSLWMLPDLGIGVVVMANTQDSRVVADLITRVVFDAKIHGGLDGEMLRAGDSDIQNTNTPASDPAGHAQLLESEFLDPTTNLSVYLGSYSHPAYGLMTVTLPLPHSSRFNSTHAHAHASTPTPDLIIHPSPRTWPFKLHLTHAFATFFRAKIYTPHGMYTPDVINDLDLGCPGPKDRDGDAEEEAATKCISQEVVWAESETVDVGFDFEPSQKETGTARRFGVKLDGTSVKEGSGRQEGERRWRDGAVWFERTSARH